MKYLLDTNICVYVINGRMLQVRERLLKENPSDVCISSICVGELAYVPQRVISLQKTVRQ